MERKKFDFGQFEEGFSSVDNSETEAKDVVEEVKGAKDDFFANLENSVEKAEKAEKAVEAKTEEPKDDFWAGFESQKKAAEEAANKLAEEEAAKKAAEEAAKKAAAEKAAAEASRLATLEAARKAAEEARALAEKAAAEAEAAKKAEEETKRRIAQEAEKKALEEAAAKAAEEEAKKKAEEEAIRLAAEAEATKKAAEEEAKLLAKQAAEEAKAAKKSAEAEAKAKKSSSDKKVKEEKPIVVPEFSDTNDSNSVDKKKLIIAAVACVLVIVLAFVGSKIIFGGGKIANLSGSEQLSNVETELTQALQSANVAIGYNFVDAKLSIANEDSYVVYFKDQYSLYKQTGSYSKSGLSNNEKLEEARECTVNPANAELIAEGVTSYYANTKDLANKTVTLSIKVTDNEGVDYTTSKSIAVNVASSTATIIEEDTTVEEDTTTEGDVTGDDTATGDDATGEEETTTEDDTIAEEDTTTEETTALPTGLVESDIEEVALTGTYQAVVGTICNSTDTFADFKAA